ncbi:MAG TPA: peptide ABC transporter substrate-binding protein [Lactovum miscens]|uniref:peptide ABC transporter substrate-binding protein n=1 Tax=Lactovum miscens TaxID=190387 RepID=UPI002ED9B17D
MKKWKKITLVAGTTSVAALAILGFSAHADAATKTPTIEIPADITTLDQSVVTDQYSNTVIGNTQEGLVRVDKSGKAALALAKSIKVSSDGLTYTIKLRDGLKWSNGDPLTAKDFVYSWQRGVDPKTASEYAYLMGCLKNANDINSGKITDLSQLGVKADSNTQLTITLEQPTPYFKFLLAQAIFLPENKSVVEKYGSEYGTSAAKMVYDGPFMFSSKKQWTGSEKSFSVVKNKKYYDAKNVKSPGVNFQVVSNGSTGASLFKSGKLDLTFLNTPTLVKANKSNKAFTTFVQARTDYLEYQQNGKDKNLTNQKFREALNLATDRQGIINAATPGSKPATSISPAGLAKAPNGEDFATFAKQGYKFDAKAAQAAFKQALSELGETKASVEIEYANDSAVATATATFLQNSWQKNLPGLTVTLKQVPFKQRLQDQQNGNFDVIIAGWGGDYAEPSTFLQMFLTGGSYNSGKFSSTEYDAAYKAASTVPDVLNNTKLYNDYKTAEAALFKGSYVNPIDYQATPALVSSNLKGLQFHSTGLNYDLKGVYLK